MTLGGLRSLDKSAIVCFLFVVSGKREPQGRKLLVSFEPAKAFLGFVHGHSGPAQSHRGRTPALHIAGDATHGPIIFSMMLVQASERRNSAGRPSLLTVRISSNPSRRLCTSSRAQIRTVGLGSEWSWGSFSLSMS